MLLAATARVEHGKVTTDAAEQWKGGRGNGKPAGATPTVPVGPSATVLTTRFPGVCTARPRPSDVISIELVILNWRRLDLTQLTASQ